MDTDRGTSATPVWPLVALGAIALLASLLRAGPALGGDLFGSDDMMRMQQIRDLIAGQNWYDVSQDRLLTPEGGAMHWSRLPDLVPAGIVWLLQPLIGRESAEALAVIAWPALQLGWVLWALVLCMRRLSITFYGQIAGLLFFCSSFALVNFLPGRIDHHGLGLALTLTALACLLSPERTQRSSTIAALCAAAMLSIAVENLPAVGLIIAGFGAAWIVRGEAEVNRLRIFGAVLIIASLIVYVFDAPGPGGNRAVCDAYGQPHFIAMLVAGAGLFSIATFFPRAREWKTRAWAMALAGAATAASFVGANPANIDAARPDCLSNPYDRLSGAVQSGWLSVVSEARGLPAVMKADLAQGLYFYGFAAAGFVSAILAVRAAPPGERFPRLVLAVFCGVALLIMIWQVRGATFAHAVSAIAAGWLFGRLYERWKERRSAGSAGLLFAGVLFVSPMGWSLPGMVEPDPPQPASAADCKSAAAFQPIAAAPRMIVFTPIDLGAPLIYHTRHYASAAPYHRNPASIEMTLSVFGGSTETARKKISMTGATHLLYCPGLNELKTYARRSPDGLAAALEAGDPPNWLVPLTGDPQAEGPIIYTIVFDRN